MIEQNNVSVQKIQEGIEYLESEFMVPLTKVGAQLIDHYKVLNNNYLKSDTINKLIGEQENKLDELQNDLRDICNKAKTTMDDSSKIINENQVNIDDTLSNI